MRELFESVIKKGDFVLGDMLTKIDTYHISGKLTDADRDALYAMARNAANPSAGVDVLKKIAELEERVKKLEGGSDSGTDAPSEYVAGKWYYAGDRVTFEGAVYTCTAPAGQVCTWSPAEYPAYWEAA